MNLLPYKTFRILTDSKRYLILSSFFKEYRNLCEMGKESTNGAGEYLAQFREFLEEGAHDKDAVVRIASLALLKNMDFYARNGHWEFDVRTYFNNTKHEGAASGA